MQSAAADILENKNKTEKINKMQITSDKNADVLTVSIQGSVDTVTAPELDNFLQANQQNIQTLILDFSAVDYISSAGLRVIMMANQNMEDCDGTLKICNVNEDVMEVFEMTGFDSLLNFE